MDNQNNQNDPNNKDNKNRRRFSGWLVMFGVALIVFFFMQLLVRKVNEQTTKEISYNEFLRMVSANEVEKVELDDRQITIKPKPIIPEGGKLKTPEELALSFTNGDITIDQYWNQLLTQSTATEYIGMTYYTGTVYDPFLTERLVAAGVEFKEVIPDTFAQILSMLAMYVLPFVILLIVFNVFFSRSAGGIMGVGKSTAKVYMQRRTGVTFADVAGQDEAKESLQECVDFLHNPDKYVKIGAKLPKGCLLVGPPGTGKTLLAKAVAGEANVPFFSLAGSDFVEMFVGVGASRVRGLFADAQKNAPCIIFIDEIDAIGKSRDTRYGGGNDEREQTLNQLLSEMDGFDSAKGILILAATNRPEILDKALLRPGRFDRRVIVEKPDLKGREDTLKVHSKNVKLDETVDLKEIALATSGAVGSDLANMVNEAAINAVKNKRELVSQKDLFDAVEVVLMGKEKKDRIMSKQERKIVSYHEIGHALIMALQKNSEPVQKITIIPRTMGALGYVMQIPEEEKYLKSEAELRDELVSFLGGRAAEEIVFDTVTTGASNDIERATGIARRMVTMYGMSKKIGLVALETIESEYLDRTSRLICSEAKEAEIDAEVQRMLKDSYKKAKKLLKENRELMDKLAAHLLEKETITGKEFMKIFREYYGEDYKKSSDPADDDDSDDSDDSGNNGKSSGSDGSSSGSSGSSGIFDLRENSDHTDSDDDGSSGSSGSSGSLGSSDSSDSSGSSDDGDSSDSSEDSGEKKKSNFEVIV